MKRLFLAIMLPDEMRTGVLRVQSVLRDAMGADGIRWVAPAQIHVTLKFLGDVDDAQTAFVVEAAERAAEQAAGFRLGVGGVGVFPARRSPQILWIGATTGVPHLTRLAQYLERELAARGFAPETRPYRPHLTLARAKTRDGEETIAKTLPALADAEPMQGEIGAFDVQEFALVHSELSAGGPTYTTLKTFALGSQTR